MKDWNYVAGVEKAVKEKYGDKAIENPKAHWNEQKEKEYIEQVKERAYLIKEKSQKNELIEENGFLIKKKLFINKSSKICRVQSCAKYSRSCKDDVCIEKYECCYACYINYIEGREDLWEERKKVMFNGNG